MARLFTSGFELNSITSGIEWTTVTSTPTITSTVFRSGVAALKIASLASGTRVGIRQQFSTSANGPFYFRTYFRADTLPTADNEIIQILDASPSTAYSIRLTSTGALKVMNNVGTQIGSNSSNLNTGQWYRVEMHYDNTPASGSRVIEARIDGTAFVSSATQTNATLAAIFRIGGNLSAETQTQGVWYFDDVAINNTSGTAQTSWPGAGNVLTLVPNAAGDANTFSTQVGGTAGASNNYTRVSETTPDDATSYNGDNTLNDVDLFKMTDSGIASTATISLVEVHGRFQNNVADATTAIKFELMKTAGGTKAQSAAIIPNTTTWDTDGTSAPVTTPIVAYTDPDGGAWTQVTLDSMQAGYIISAGSTNRIDVTKVWVNVEYVPPAGGTTDQFLGFF